jgi:predicted dehydrogenase
MRKVKIGVIGCGNISEKYIDNMTNIFRNTEVIAVTDIITENAEKRARQFEIPYVCMTNEELFSIPEIEIVVVLTNPSQHFSVCEASLLAGKHTYVEKPLSLNTEDAKKLLELADKKGLMLAGAPDTILGSGMQTARKLLDDGWIGRPIAAISHILTGGPESWHPSPAFLYHIGAGPLYDVAPYYVAGLSYLLGPVESVMCSAKITYPQRTVTSQPLYGTKIDVEVPTYLAGILNMENGVIATIHHSFDVNDTKLDNSVEIYGTEGTLIVPTPCNFSGDIWYKKKTMEDWSKVPCIFQYSKDSRGVGVADMAAAILENKSQRLTKEFGYHTLEVLEQLDNSQKYGQARKIESTFEISEPMKTVTGWSE